MLNPSALLQVFALICRGTASIFPLVQLVIEYYFLWKYGDGKQLITFNTHLT